MRSRRLAITLATTLALAWPTSAPTAQTREEYYYGIEINGTLCGYVKVTAEPRRTDGREHVLLTHDSVIRSTLLGGPVDVRLTLTTIGEADYIDSGHIRIGVFQSVATSLNGQRFEVLDHRVSAPAAPRQRQRLAPAWSGARAPGQAGAAEAAEALLGALADPRPTVRRDAAVEAARAAASGPPAPWDRKAQRCQPERSAATIVSGAVSYGGRRYPLYPATLDAQPGLPSPLTAADGTELVVAILRDGRYGIVPATLRVDERQCDADATDFPSLAATGLHTDVDLARTRVITGRTTREIADLARPGALSVEGFLGAGEDIIDVLARDNRAVMALGLTHPELARPLFHIWNMMRTDIDLGRWDRARHRWSNVEAILSYGRRVSLVAGDTKGGQLSVFNDGLVGGFWIEITREPTAAERRFLQARYRHLGARRMDALVRLLTHMRTGEIQPHYVMWYGFYEGKTPWRVDPIAITFVFGLRTIEEIEAAFPGRLYTVLANAGVSPATRK